MIFPFPAEDFRSFRSFRSLGANTPAPVRAS